MSTLYGNDAAVQYARSNAGRDYPAGAIVSLVTWTQQEDARWFGARIPGQVKAVEFVNVTSGPDNRRLYAYQKYEGSPLQRTSQSEGPAPEARAAFLLSRHADVIP
jgi:hypothetical protein